MAGAARVAVGVVRVGRAREGLVCAGPFPRDLSGCRFVDGGVEWTVSSPFAFSSSTARCVSSSRSVARYRLADLYTLVDRSGLLRGGWVSTASDGLLRVRSLQWQPQSRRYIATTTSGRNERVWPWQILPA